MLLESKDLNGGQFGTTSPFESETTFAHFSLVPFLYQFLILLGGSLAFFSFYKNKSNVFLQCKQRIYQGQNILVRLIQR